MTMQFKQETVDPLDLDEYLDFSQGTFSPSSTSTPSSRAKTLQTPGLNAPRATPIVPATVSQNTFAAPSHQYDLHKQTTGFPMGAVANTIATQRQLPSSMSAINNGFGGVRNGQEIFDFGAMPPNASFSNVGDVDMDFESPVDGFMPSRPGSDAGFVDPSAVGGEDSGARATPVRLWPGMHTQQAALAKQQQQQEIMRQQQQKAVQQQQQQQQTANLAQHKRGNSRSNPAGKSTDPVVEERISRLLNQMRNSSVSSAEGGETANGSGQSHSQRSRKDEEDMDDDERLLASEEGKKLSSKERRQLRNKVSARAFRSRRKEYISQLEGEISGKAKDNDDLRSENNALKAENQRLTDLSKMLLASPAFSNFLNDLSSNSMPTLMENMAAQQQQPQEQQTQQQPQQPKVRQQAVQQQRQQTSQQSMSSVQEEVDFSNLDTNGNWGVGMDFGFDATVFAVTELPQGPAVDQEALSGKYSSYGVSTESTFSKKSMPVITPIELPTAVAPAPQPAAAPVVDNSVEFDESHPAYALFADDESSAPSTLLAPATVENTVQLFGAIPLEKAFARIELVEESDATRNAGAAAERRFVGICARLDDLVLSIQ